MNLQEMRNYRIIVGSTHSINAKVYTHYNDLEGRTGESPQLLASRECVDSDPSIHFLFCMSTQKRINQPGKRSTGLKASTARYAVPQNLNQEVLHG